MKIVKLIVAVMVLMGATSAFALGGRGIIDCRGAGVSVIIVGSRAVAHSSGERVILDCSTSTEDGSISCLGRAKRDLAEVTSVEVQPAGNGGFSGTYNFTFERNTGMCFSGCPSNDSTSENLVCRRR